jgi:hypothetical protein
LLNQKVSITDARSFSSLIKKGLNKKLYKGAPLQKKAERIGARPFSTSKSVSPNSSSTRCNTFLIDLDRKAKGKYDSLPAKSILKHPDSFVSQRIVYLEEEVLAFYKLSSECKKDIQEFFTTPVKLDIPGIYCFMSKNRSAGGRLSRPRPDLQ